MMWQMRCGELSGIAGEVVRGIPTDGWSGSSSFVEASLCDQVKDGLQLAVLLELEGVCFIWPHISKRYPNPTWGIPMPPLRMLLKERRGNSHRLIHVSTHWFAVRLPRHRGL